MQEPTTDYTVDINGAAPAERRIQSFFVQVNQKRPGGAKEPEPEPKFDLERWAKQHQCAMQERQHFQTHRLSPECDARSWRMPGHTRPPASFHVAWSCVPKQHFAIHPTPCAGFWIQTCTWPAAVTVGGAPTSPSCRRAGCRSRRSLGACG